MMCRMSRCVQGFYALHIDRSFEVRVRHPAYTNNDEKLPLSSTRSFCCCMLPGYRGAEETRSLCYRCHTLSGGQSITDPAPEESRAKERNYSPRLAATTPYHRSSMPRQPVQLKGPRDCDPTGKGYHRDSSSIRGACSTASPASRVFSTTAVLCYSHR